jgi:hypothetical protein
MTQRVNQVRTALSLLSAIVSGGECHTEQSKKELAEAHAALDELGYQELNEENCPEYGEEAVFINENNVGKELSSFGQTMPPKYYFDCYTHFLRL